METKKERFQIDCTKWPEAEDWGWGTSQKDCLEFEPELPAGEALKLFIKRRLPVICEVFYNTIWDGLIAAGVDEGDACEFVEEELACQLDEFLIAAGHEYCQELIKKVG